MLVVPRGRLTRVVGLLDDEVHPAVWAIRHDLRGDERARRRVTRDHVESAEHHLRETVREPADLAEVRSEREPLVDRPRDGLAEQVLHDVVGGFEALRLHRARRPALGSGRPPLSVEQAGDLVLLGHVVELMPFEIRRVVAVS